MNGHLTRFCGARDITFTRSRPYHKNDNTQVSILSTPKTGITMGGALDMGENRKNIDTIMRNLSQELTNYHPIRTRSALNSKEDIYNWIRELAKLRIEGILTEEDFEMKKKELLDEA